MTHLILLVGTNPVPNAVTAALLGGEVAKITLLSSKDSHKIGQRLSTWIVRRLGDRAPSIHLEALSKSGDEYRPEAIGIYVTDRLSKVWAQERPSRIHVHYTGGTKTMSVHARDAARQWCRDQTPQVGFEASYLDPNDLALIRDPGESPEATQKATAIPPESVPLHMSDFLELHGWEPELNPRVRPILPRLALTLAKAHSTEEGVAAWDEWKEWKLLPKTRSWKSHPGRFPKGEMTEIETPSGRWLRNKRLFNSLEIAPPDHPVLPKLWLPDTSLSDALLHLLSDDDPNGRRCKPHSLCKWLDGTWLESAVLETLNELQDEKHLHEILMDFEPKRRGSSSHSGDFQFDVVAVRGYRLFAFSCTTGDQDPGLLKHKLFEASVRARQMGGDEARTVLVCCASKDKAESLEQELEHELDLKGKIAVLGQPHLADLKGSIGAWLDKN